MEFTQDCIFNETMETQNYNTYISARWSTKERTLYLGMDNSGKPRTITITGEDRKLGKMFDCARVLTQVASPDRVVETLHRRMLAGAKHNVRHQHHSHDHHRQIGSDVAQHAICPSSSIQKSVGDGRDSFRCRKRKKRKKRKRRCRPDEQPGPQCRLAEGSVTDSTIDRYVTDMSSEIISTTPESKRSCEGAASEEACRRQALSVPAKKRKSRIHSKFGKNKASTSNMKKPNVTVANSQSKKPNLTDGKKKMRKRTSPSQTSRGSTVMASPSRKRHEAGTTSLSRASSSLTAPVREEHLASTATSSSSPSPPGALTTLSIRRPSSPSDRKKPPSSSKNHITKSMGSRRIGKSFSSTTGLPRSTSMTSTTSRSEIAFVPSATKVPENMCAYANPLFRCSPVPLSSPSSRQESNQDSSSSLSNSSLVDEESSSIVTSSLVDKESSSTITSSLATVTESSTLDISDETITFRLDEKNDEDDGFDMADTISQTTTRVALERLAM